MNETMLGFQWIKETMLADATMVSLAQGGFFRAMAPPKTLPVWIIVAKQSGNDSLTMNGVRLLSTILFQIKAVGDAKDTEPIIDAANQIEALFGGPTGGTTSGGYIDSCYRDGDIEMDQLVAGKLQTNIGGFYRLEIQRTP